MNKTTSDFFLNAQANQSDFLSEQIFLQAHSPNQMGTFGLDFEALGGAIAVTIGP